MLEIMFQFTLFSMLSEKVGLDIIIEPVTVTRYISLDSYAKYYLSVHA